MEIDFSSVLTGFIGTVITGTLAYFGIMRKTRADETALALAAWRELIDPLKDELRETKEEVKKLRNLLEDTETKHKVETTKLIKRIRELEQANRDR